MNSVQNNHEQSLEIEASQMTTLTLLASRGPSSDTMDQNTFKLNELQHALSLSPSQFDCIEMSGATGKKMKRVEQSLGENSGTFSSSYHTTEGTPKRAKYNPYCYDSLKHQVDVDQSSSTETGATSDQQTINCYTGVQETVIIASDISGKASTNSNSGSTTSTWNGQDETHKDPKSTASGPEYSG